MTKTIKQHHKEIIVLIGKPGSGKGTQADPLAKALGIPFVSTGKLMRAEIKKGTRLGKTIAADVATGRLVDNAVTALLLRRRLAKPDTHQGLIIDGSPRDLEQALMLDKISHVTHAILISITDKEVIRRLSGRRVCSKCGHNYHVELHKPKVEGICDLCGGKIIHRDDDKPSIIKERLKSYREDTIPVLQYYRRLRALRRVDGLGSIDEVGERALAVVRASDKGLKLYEERHD
jgi:adenylate kinase